MSQINKLLWTFGAISCVLVLYYFSPFLAVILILISALGYLYLDYERQQGRSVLVHADKFTRHLKTARSWFINKFINRQQLSDSISTPSLPRSMPSRSNYPANSTNRSMSNSHYDQNSNLNENSIRRRAGVGNFHRISSPGDAFHAMSPISRDPNTSNDFRNLSISDARNTTLPNCRNHSGYLSPILYDSSHQKISSPGTSSRNVQTLGGPLLASTRYNLSSESALFADVNSPGLSSRIARLSEDTRSGSQPATHQSQYSGPGQFPMVHLGQTSRLPVMSLRSTQKTSRAAVRLRMSPRPLASDALIASDRCRALSEPPPAQPTRSVLDTLHELSRKRLHAQLDEPPEDVAKKQRTQRETETTKRVCDESPEHGQKKKRACGNEITSSLSSSRHIVVERASKRKTAYEDIVDDCLSASSAGKIAKKSEPTVAQPPPNLFDEDQVMSEPPPVEQKQTEQPKASTTSPVVPISRKPKQLREATEWSRRDLNSTEEEPVPAERVGLQDLRTKREFDMKSRLRTMMSVIRRADEVDGPTPSNGSTAPSSITILPTAEAAKPAAKHVTFAENLATVKTFDGSSDSRNELPSTIAQVSVTASLTNPIVSAGIAAPSTSVTLEGFPAIKPQTPSTVPAPSATPSPSTFNIATTTFNVATTTSSGATTTLSFPSLPSFGSTSTSSSTLTFPSPSTFNVAKTSVTTSTLSPSSTFNIAKTPSATITFPAQSTLEATKTTASAFPAPSTFNIVPVTTASEPSKPAAAFGTASPFAFGTATTASSTFGSPSVTFGTKTSEPITFGNKSSTAVTFGDKSTAQATFEAKPSTPVTFGEKSTPLVSFGDKSATPVTFGDKSASLVAFGDKSITPVTFGDKPSTPAFSSTFGGAPPPYPASTTQNTNTFGFGTPSTVAPPPPYAPTSSAGFSFGQTQSTGGFSFGSAKPTATTFGGSGDNATFGLNKDTPVFGVSKESPFGSKGKTEVAVFGAKTSAPAFGAKPKAAVFGSTKPNAFQFNATTTTAGGFAFDAAKPAFGVATNGPTTTTSTFAFGTAAPKPFGFGDNGSAFGAAATAPKEGIFSFGQSSTKPAATGGFGFGGAQQTQPPAPAAGGFSFGGASTSTPAFGATPTPTFGATSAPTFGATSTATPTFGASSTATPTFGAGSTATPTFGAASTATPTFGAASTATPTFGASSTATPAFGASSTPSFGSGTGFGATAPAPTAGGFSFFSDTTTTPAAGGFNFSAGAAPVSFGATPQANAFQTGGVAQFGAAPAPGMFSIGTGSTGPRGRQMRSRRR